MSEEELDDKEVEIEPVTEFNLHWKCKQCNEENSEYDITLDGWVICECMNCGKRYKYYHCVY